MILSAILLTAFGAVVAYAVYKFVERYRAAEGSTWQKLLAAAHGSATMLTAYATTLGGYLLTYAAQLGDFFNAPEVRETINGFLAKTPYGPELIGGFAMVLGALVLVSRARSLFWSTPNA
jgi:hypothetical protein